MKNQQHPSHENHERSGANLFSRLNTSQKLTFALVTLSYVTFLLLFYNMGCFLSLSFSIKEITNSVISKNTSPSQQTVPRSSEVKTQCAEPVPFKLIHQKIIDQVYNGTSPYENISPRVASSLLPKKTSEWGSYGVIYKSLIQKVRPKAIIQFSTSLGLTATYLANLTDQLGLKTQILCLRKSLDGFEDKATPDDNIVLLNQFIRHVRSQNATESILPVPLSIDVASDKFCGWGIYGDLVEVDAGPDFHSAWSDINKAYKLLRPGGVLFGHNYFSSDLSYDKGASQAVRLFAHVNKFHVKVEGRHWIIKLA